MRRAVVYINRERAGLLTEHDNGSFEFIYDALWLADDDKAAISLTMPKQTPSYLSDHLFPVFYNLLPEGVNKQAVCRLGKIDKDDHFGLLLTTARYDTVGAISVIPLSEMP